MVRSSRSHGENVVNCIGANVKQHVIEWRSWSNYWWVSLYTRKSVHTSPRVLYKLYIFIGGFSEEVLCTKSLLARWSLRSFLLYRPVPEEPPSLYSMVPSLYLGKTFGYVVSFRCLTPSMDPGGSQTRRVSSLTLLSVSTQKLRP